MNVCFNLATPELEKLFLARALAAGFSGLGGHRAIGGVRASLYNAMTLSAVGELAGFMKDFQDQQTTATSRKVIAGDGAWRYGQPGEFPGDAGDFAVLADQRRGGRTRQDQRPQVDAS
jgi:hypothetical protein